MTAAGQAQWAEGQEHRLELDVGSVPFSSHVTMGGLLNYIKEQFLLQAQD